MKLFRFVIFFVLCSFKSLLFCAANTLDESRHFKCSIAKTIDSELINKPFKIFLVMQHPHISDNFRYLTSEEFVDYKSKIDDINERIKKLSWYDFKEAHDLNRIQQSFKNLHYLILLDDGLPVVFDSKVEHSASLEIARELLLKKIEACQREKDRKNDL